MILSLSISLINSPVVNSCTSYFCKLKKNNVPHIITNKQQQKDYDEDKLEEANAFATVGNQANRINCATIGWRALQEMIDQEEEAEHGGQD